MIDPTHIRILGRRPRGLSVVSYKGMEIDTPDCGDDPAAYTDIVEAMWSTLTSHEQMWCLRRADRIAKVRELVHAYTDPDGVVWWRLGDVMVLWSKETRFLDDAVGWFDRSLSYDGLAAAMAYARAGKLREAAVPDAIGRDMAERPASVSLPSDEGLDQIDAVLGVNAAPSTFDLLKEDPGDVLAVARGEKEPSAIHRLRYGERSDA